MIFHPKSIGRTLKIGEMLVKKPGIKKGFKMTKTQIQNLEQSYLAGKRTVSETLAELSRAGIGKQQAKDVLYDWNSKAAGKEFLGWFTTEIFGYNPL